jgi:hypothetical protein
MGQQDPPGKTEEAETATGAVDWQWLGRRSLGPPYLHLRRHHGWFIEVLFRANKQVLDVEAPQHWSQESVEKLAPWVWSMQSVIMVWYITAGSKCAEAEDLRQRLGEWDSEWSLRHMIQVLRRAILNTTINPDSANEPQLREMVQTLKNWANLAA